MTLDASHLLDHIEYNGGEQVLVSNGKGLQFDHLNSSIFKPFSSSHSFKLHNLLHFSHLTKNLLSVS